MLKDKFMMVYNKIKGRKAKKEELESEESEPEETEEKRPVKSIESERAYLKSEASSPLKTIDEPKPILIQYEKDHGFRFKII